MKITFVSPEPDMSGGCRVIAIHADRLRARGHDVHVVAPPIVFPRVRDRLRDLARGRRPARKDGRSHFDTMASPLSVIDRPRPVTDADLPDADAVIATWWETAFAVNLLSPAKGAKFYFVQGHEVFDHLPRHISAGSYFLPLERIAVSRWLSDTLRDRYGVETRAVVPNSVDAAQFHAPPRGRQAAPTVGLIHATLPLKGLDTTLAAVDRLRHTFPDLRVVAFGKERPGGALRLPDNATYVRNPPQDRLRDLYAMCDVFVSGSRSEGSGLPIMEAMACRCPVVATRTGSAEDVIAPGVNGHVVDVDDADAMAARVSDVLNLAPDDWAEMSSAALATVQGYTWNEAAARFEAALLGGIAAAAPRP